MASEGGIGTRLARTIWDRSPTTLHPLLQFAHRTRPGNRPRWGNLRRVPPVSVHFGYDRGTPVGRPFVEGFVERHQDLIRGDVLEIRSADYARRYAVEDVRPVVLDIDSSNPDATVIGDLCDTSLLAAESLDCAILTQTLQLVNDPNAALQNLWQALRPGGAMIVTVPATSRIDPESRGRDRWRWTPVGLRVQLTRLCPSAQISIEGFGNLSLIVAAMMGLAAEDVGRRQFSVHDPSFPLVSCALVVKAP